MRTDYGDGLFLPQVGDEFTILTAVGGVAGQFLNAPVSQVDGMLYHWSVIANSFDGNHAQQFPAKGIHNETNSYLVNVDPGEHCRDRKPDFPSGSGGAQ